MNRQVTGWLAWSTLAFVISVPSADLVFSQSESLDVAQAISVAEVSLNEVPDMLPSPVSKRVWPENVDIFEAPVIERISAKKTNVEDIAPAVPFGPPVPLNLKKVEIRSIDLAALPSSSFDDVLPMPGPKQPIGSPIPIEFRIVGEQPVLIAELTETPVAPNPASRVGSEQLAVQPRSTIRVVGDRGMALILADNTDQIVVDAPKPATAPKVVPVTQGDGGGARTAIQTAMLDVTPYLLGQPAIVAPVPMPASMRPNKLARAEVANIANDSFVEDVRASIDNIRRSDDAKLQPVSFHELVGRNAETQSIQQLQDGPQRLDTFPFEELQRENTTGDGAFLELWAEGQRPAGFTRFGSFESQLPAQRGDAVRLDLLN